MINRVVLTGRVAHDLELKYTNNGTAVAQFRLAVERRFTNQAGQREADFINCVLWRKAAEIFVQYMHKGSLVGIEGRLQSRSYDDTDGKKVYVTEVVADDFSFLESKQDSQNNQPTQQSAPQYSAQGNAGPKPTQQPQNQTQPAQKTAQGSQMSFGDIGQKVDISDDDLPF